MCLLKHRIVLHYLNFSKEFSLETDASNIAIGAVLKQGNHIIGIYGKKLNKTESNYSILTKEILGIIKGMQNFNSIIFNLKIIIKTDNKNITNNTEAKSRITHWKMQLTEYDYVMTHVEGKNNQLVIYCLESLQ